MFRFRFHIYSIANVYAIRAQISKDNYFNWTEVKTLDLIPNKHKIYTLKI